MAELIDKQMVINVVAKTTTGGYFSRAIEKVDQLPTTTESEIRAKAYTEFASEIMKYINSSNRNNADYFIVDQIEELCSKYIEQNS